jgi:heat shock protein HspQ
MELKARKPEELLELLELKKNQKNDDVQKVHSEDKYEEIATTKRKRKQNPFYSN